MGCGDANAVGVFTGVGNGDEAIFFTSFGSVGLTTFFTGVGTFLMVFLAGAWVTIFLFLIGLSIGLGFGLGGGTMGVGSTSETLIILAGILLISLSENTPALYAKKRITACIRSDVKTKLGIDVGLYR